MALFNYELLDSRIKRLYIQLYEGLRTYQSEIRTELYLENELVTAYHFVLYDHPELFWVDGSFSYTRRNDGIIIRPNNNVSFGMHLQMIERLDSVLREIILRASSVPNLYDRILYVHDCLVSLSDYDQRAKNDYDNYPLASTAYGCLVEGKAICSGYTKAFQLILQKLGVSCGYVSGVLNNGGRHAWNYVKYNGDFYYVDVTFDDPIHANKLNVGNQILHNWFFVSTKEIERNRRIIHDGFYPVCRMTALDYYHSKNLYFERYDFNIIKYAIKRALSQTTFVEMKFVNARLLWETIDDLFEKGRWQDIVDSRRISYSIDETLYILFIYINT